MIEGAFEIMKRHNFKTLILVSRISEITDWCRVATKWPKFLQVCSYSVKVC